MTNPDFDIVHYRNELITWVAITHKGRDIFTVHLPKDISDKDLEATKRQILDLFTGAFLMGHRIKTKEVQRGIKTLLGL
jgi:hypothetical protein